MFKWGALALVFTLCSTSFADGQVGKRLYNKYKKAVVKISVYEHGLPLSVGTGFFIGQKGYIATNYHVVKAAFKSGYNLVIETHDQKKITDFKIGTCSDSRSIDLCFIKVDFKPKMYFSAKNITPEKGENIYVIGHPFGLDYTFSDGLVSNFKPAESAEDIDGIQISAPISPGNSGGPIFSENGQLYGMATSINGSRLAQNLNFGIAVSEIFNMAKKPSAAVSVKSYKKKMDLKIKKAIHKISKDFYSDAIKNLKRGEKQRSIDDVELPRFKLEKFKIGDGYYLTFVPAFYNCSQYKQSDEHNGFVCVDQLTQATQIDFSFFHYPGESLFMDLHNKDDHESRPVKNVKALKMSGQWEKLKTTLTPHQIKGLHSYQLEPWRCKKRGDHSVYYIYDKTEMCKATLMNDTEPNAITRITLFQDKRSKMIVKVAGHVKNRNYKKLGFLGSKISTQLIRYVSNIELQRRIANESD